MSWQEGVATGVIVLALFAGAYLAAQRPAFWIEFGSRLFAKLAPVIWVYLSRQEPEDVRKARQQCERQGGVWDHARKRCRNR